MRAPRCARWLIGSALLLSAALAACDGGGEVADAGAADAGSDDDTCHPNLPEPSDPCLEGQCGNALGVGMPCSVGGNECSMWFETESGEAGATFCTGDFSDTDLVFCTKACTVDDQCGSGAICEVDPDDPESARGCIPASCAGDE